MKPLKHQNHYRKGLQYIPGSQVNASLETRNCLKCPVRSPRCSPCCIQILPTTVALEPDDSCGHSVAYACRWPMRKTTEHNRLRQATTGNSRSIWRCMAATLVNTYNPSWSTSNSGAIRQACARSSKSACLRHCVHTSGFSAVCGKATIHTGDTCESFRSTSILTTTSSNPYASFTEQQSTQNHVKVTLLLPYRSRRRPPAANWQLYPDRRRQEKVHADSAVAILDFAEVLQP